MFCNVQYMGFMWNRNMIPLRFPKTCDTQGLWPSLDPTNLQNFDQIFKNIYDT